MKIAARSRALASSALVIAAMLSGCARGAIEPAKFLRPGARDLAPYLDALGKAREIPGAVAIVLRGNEIIAEGAWGVRKLGAPEPVAIDDPFHLGSCTKSMTATLAGMLVDEGKLKWSTTLADLFAADVPKFDPAWRRVTLAQVLAHRSGLPANYPWADFPKHHADSRPLPEQRRAIVAAALAQPPEYPPGSKESYSNLGYITVGAAVEKLTGQAWEDIMRERLFAPLGIATGGFGAPNTPGKVDAPWGHRDHGEPFEGDNPKDLGPAGTVHMSVRDWAKFVALHLRGDASNPERAPKLLSPAAFDALHPGKGQRYFAGWVHEPDDPALRGHRTGDTGKVYWHAGSNTAWYATVVLAPEVDGAVLLAVNRYDPKIPRGCEDSARALLHFYFGATAAK